MHGESGEGTLLPGAVPASEKEGETRNSKRRRRGDTSNISFAGAPRTSSLFSFYLNASVSLCVGVCVCTRGVK